MAFQVSPGVVVKEVDLTTIVPSVATTIGGFAGQYEWGPADQLITVDSPKNYVSLFGYPKNLNASDWFCAENFLRYGRNLLVSRVTHADAKNASTLGGTKQYIPNDGTDISVMTADFHARYPGERGNSLKISMGGNGVTSSWSYFNYFGRSPESSDNIINAAGTTTNDQVHFIVIDELGYFTNEPGTVLEKFSNVSLHPEARNLNGESNYIVNVINNQSKYMKISGSQDVYPFASYFAGGTFGVTNSGYEFTWSTPRSFTKTLDGGTGSFGASDARRYNTAGKGYQLFADKESVDVSLIIGGTTKSSNVQYLKNLVEDRKDCVAFVSCPVDGNEYNKTESEKVTICKNFRQNNVGSSSYVVVDSGYKKQSDPYNQVSRWVPLNGDVAGVVARTDTTFDPWFSPAGLNRGQIRNVDLLAFNPNLTSRDQIYPEGVNPVISVVGEGTILYGDKTAQNKPSAFDRINVRRLFIVLEKAIEAASKYSLFEQNDSFTRQQFRSLVEPFLRDVKARRGIFDFKVVCDDTNNTPERIDRNEFVADIYIKPSRTINFIKLNFIATRTGVSFAEVGA